MSKRDIRLPVSPLRTGELVLTQAQSRYVCRVHRLGRGDRFTVFDPEARTEATAHVLVEDGRAARCHVETPRPALRTVTWHVTLLQAVGKGDKLDQVIRDATQLGVARIIVLETERSVPKLSAKANERGVRWRKIAMESARQCGRGDLPEIVGPLGMQSVLEGLDDAALKLCFHPVANVPLAQALASWTPARPVTFLIGPEGGLSEREVSAALSHGFVGVRLGPFVLRTETAAVAALGAVLARVSSGDASSGLEPDGRDTTVA